MTILPVIARELRVAARRPWTYRVRWGTAGLLCGTWILLLLLTPACMPPERLSQTLFEGFSTVCFGPALLAGVFLTAESVSRERQEGTLGLLFLTDLRGYDVVLGKLVGHSVNAVFGLLAALPLLGVPLLMGGVTPAQFFGLNSVLLATLAFSLAVGMLASVLTRDVRQSMLATFGVLLGLGGLLPTLWLLLRLAFNADVLEWLLLWPSPAYALGRVLNGKNPLNSAGLLLTLAVGCVGLACWRLPRIWQRESDPTRPARMPPALHTPRPLCPEDDPGGWLVIRRVRSQRVIWWVLAVLGIVWLLAWVGLMGNQEVRGFAVVAFGLGFGIHAIFKCLVVLEATQRISEDAASGALELLLVTPLPARTLVEGMVAGLHRRLLGPTIAVSFVNVLLLAWLTKGEGPGSREMPIFLYTFLGGLGVLWLDRSTLIWTGVLQALRRRRHTRAALATMVRILVPPWLLMVLLAFLAEMNVFSGPDGPELIMFAWFVAGGLLSAAHWVSSREKLVSEFRRIAASASVSTAIEVATA